MAEDPPEVSLIEARARELDVLTRAVIATDHSGSVVYWNSHAERLYGWTKDEALGRSIADLTPAPHTRTEALKILDLLRGGSYWSGQFAVARKDGQTFMAHILDAPVHDEGGNFVGVIGLSSDVSPIAQLQRLARDLSAALTPADVATIGLQACMDIVGASGGWFFIFDRESQSLQALASRGYDPADYERFRSIPIDAPVPLAIAARTGEPLFIESREEWARLFPALLSHTDPRTREWVSLPLMLGQRLVGAVGLSVRFVRDFPESDRELLLAISQHAAVAVERALLFEAERKARKLAEEANSVKSAFLATMSHELRTPLGAIIGYHDLLAAEIVGPLNPKQQEHLRRLRGAATHLLSLIDEVLTFARLEAAHETVNEERRPVGRVLEEVSDIVKPLAEAKGLAFSTTCECDANATELRTDMQKLRQILVNLAGNAVKYTERGSVTLHCRMEGREFVAEVRDTGIGIAPHHLERIFDPFWQVHGTRNRRTGGTGLGLSVSRKLAQLLGGDIAVRSEVGQGSVFTLRVPA